MNNYNEKERKIILQAANDTIKYGLENHQVLQIKLEAYPEKLQEQAATFVTLEINNQLRGCIGTLEAHQPLIVDVAYNSFAAAFQDQRFPPLNVAEYPLITKHISILSKPEPIQFNSEANLLQKIQPEIDGLIISDQGHRGTFLPSVWKSLPKPEIFLQHLKMKAGLPQDYWSDTIQVERYSVEVIE